MIELRFTLLLIILLAAFASKCADAENFHGAGNRRIKRSVHHCIKTDIGDGWCDHSCNNWRHQFDGGDCCKATCRNGRYKCGVSGYHCRHTKYPVWFLAQTKLCYKWYPDGNGGQCGAGHEPRHLCAPINSATQYYRDDTDNRGGGCRMSWGIESPRSARWFKNVEICYRWYPDGDGGQCGGGANRELCATVGRYTPVYRDDTDNRAGGCQMSWSIKLPVYHGLWAKQMKLCYEWYADGNSGECGSRGTPRKLCAVANQWTPYYGDDTDDRSGGCRMRWGLYTS